MPAAADEKLAKFKDDWKSNTEKIVLESFPQKILEIDSLINSKAFDLNRLPEFSVDLNIPVPQKIDGVARDDDVPSKKRKLDNNSASTGDHDVEGTKVMAFINGTVPCNRHIVELTDFVKPILREMLENVNKVKMWILFLIPRIEDGNNFGVSIQEDTLAEVRTVEAEAASFLDQISRYFLTRGKIVSKVARYPHVDDYRRSIMDLDEKEFVNLRLILMEIRNHYSTLHDIIMKNYEKIKKPRSSNLEHLY